MESVWTFFYRNPTQSWVWVVSMAEPPKPFATRHHGESYGVGTWREGGEWREHSEGLSDKIKVLELTLVAYTVYYCLYTQREK